MKDTVLLGILIMLLIATLYVMIGPIDYITVNLDADKTVYMTSSNFRDIREFTKMGEGGTQPIGLKILKFEGISTVEYCLISCYQWNTMQNLRFRFIRGGSIIEIQFDPKIWTFEGTS